jgi:hypothetical protein
MDTDEKSEMGGGAPRSTAKKADDGETSKSGDSGGAKSKSSAKKGDSKAKTAAAQEEDPAHPYIPHKGDGEYGITKRRGEGLYVLKDVPYIQYFAAGYALHAAYWHDVFGTRRSHGCVNLSPIDAHRVFNWTEPAVPEGWHAVNTGEEMGEGTTVIVHE